MNLIPNIQTSAGVVAPDVAARQLASLRALLGTIPRRVIACSGGIDSMLLATVAHRQDPSGTVVAHAVSPAVPAAATARVHERAALDGWNLHIVSSGEFDSEQYLSNPANRCYFCKSHLYKSLEVLGPLAKVGTTLMSGANLDDLGEYRPGLIAAAENAVRHPLIEAGIDKVTIRAIARLLDLPFAELAASPCLASRLYTGTRVTPERLRAIDAGENLIRERTGIDVVRCRVRESEMMIEVGAENRELISQNLLDAVLAVVQSHEPAIAQVQLDAQAYRAGRAFVRVPA